MDKIQKERLSLLLSSRRMNKLRGLAKEQEKTMTQLIQDWLDTLPEPKQENNNG